MCKCACDAINCTFEFVVSSFESHIDKLLGVIILNIIQFYLKKKGVEIVHYFLNR